MNEITVTVNQTPGVIECNFDEIKEALAVQMTAYTGMEITEEGIKDAKSDLATLRKIRKAVDDRRKEIKRDFAKPYDAFEAQVKDVLAVIDKPIGEIDAQLKAFEEKRKAEKQAHIRELYEANVGEYAAYLPLEAIKNPKWDNATCGDNEIASEIQERKLKVQGDLDTIKALHSEIEEDLFEAYRRSGNTLAAAVQKNADYLDAKKRAEERIAAEAARKAEEEKAQAEKAAETEPIPEPAPVAPTACQPAQPVETWGELPFTEKRIRFTVSEGDAQAVREFLQFNGIEYEEVEA